MNAVMSDPLPWSRVRWWGAIMNCIFCDNGLFLLRHSNTLSLAAKRGQRVLLPRR